MIWLRENCHLPLRGKVTVLELWLWRTDPISLELVIFIIPMEHLGAFYCSGWRSFSLPPFRPQLSSLVPAFLRRARGEKLAGSLVRKLWNMLDPQSMPKKSSIVNFGKSIRLILDKRPWLQATRNLVSSLPPPRVEAYTFLPVFSLRSQEQSALLAFISDLGCDIVREVERLQFAVLCPSTLCVRTVSEVKPPLRGPLEDRWAEAKTARELQIIGLSLKKHLQVLLIVLEAQSRLVSRGTALDVA